MEDVTLPEIAQQEGTEGPAVALALQISIPLQDAEHARKFAVNGLAVLVGLAFDHEIAQPQAGGAFGLLAALLENRTDAMRRHFAILKIQAAHPVHELHFLSGEMRPA